MDDYEQRSPRQGRNSWRKTDTAIPVESKPIFWNTTLRIDQPIKIEATDATVQLQMMAGHNLSYSRSLQAQIEKQYRTQLFCS